MRFIADISLPVTGDRGIQRLKERVKKRKGRGFGGESGPKAGDDQYEAMDVVEVGVAVLLLLLLLLLLSLLLW